MLVERGAAGISHLTFTFGGSNPEIEIAEPLERGRLVTLDLGAIVGGYCSDNRRYAFTGELPDEVRETYDAMVAIGRIALMSGASAVQRAVCCPSSHAIARASRSGASNSSCLTAAPCT